MGFSGPPPSQKSGETEGKVEILSFFPGIGTNPGIFGTRCCFPGFSQSGLAPAAIPTFPRVFFPLNKQLDLTLEWAFFGILNPLDIPTPPPFPLRPSPSGRPRKRGNEIPSIEPIPLLPTPSGSASRSVKDFLSTATGKQECCPWFMVAPGIGSSCPRLA